MGSLFVCSQNKSFRLRRRFEWRRNFKYLVQDGFLKNGVKIKNQTPPEALGQRDPNLFRGPHDVLKGNQRSENIEVLSFVICWTIYEVVENES